MPTGPNTWRIDQITQSPVITSIEVGGVDNRSAVLEVDLSQFLGMRDDPSRIQNVQLRLDPSHLLRPDFSYAVGNTVYFVALDGLHGRELWRTDGTLGGTTLVKDINPGSGSAFASGVGASSFGTLNGNLVFAASNGVIGTELWTTDGTAAGTILIKDIYTGLFASNPSGFATIGGTIFFSAGDAAGGVELWKSDGTTAGTSRILDFNSGTASSTPTNLTALNNTLYFVTDWFGARTLFKLDANNPTNTIFTMSGSSPANLTIANGKLFYTAVTGGYSGRQLLYATGGGINGTAVSVVPINGTADADPSQLVATGDRLYVRAKSGADGNAYRLFFVDSSFTASRVLGSRGALGPQLDSMTAVGNILYVWVTDASNQPKLWQTDGTAPGTHQVAVVNNAGEVQEVTLSPLSGPMQVFNGQLYFAATDDIAVGGSQLWRADAAGAHKAVNIDPAFQAVTSEAVYFYRGSDANSELWRTDGTPQGTYAVRDSAPYLASRINVMVLNDEGDGLINQLDPAAPATLAAQFQTTDLSVDLTDLIRAALAKGQTRLTLRLEAETPTNSPMGFLPAGTSQSRTGVTGIISQQAGYLLDLIDVNGGVLVHDQPIVDLRRYNAGTYYLRVHTPTPDEAGAYELDFLAPQAGHAHPASDRDYLSGGDGDDALIGNADLDHLLGESGNDSFTGDEIEVLDKAAGETRTSPPASQTGPSVHVSIDPIVTIPDAALRAAIGAALGIPVTTGANGLPLLSHPIHASELSTLTHLDLTGLNVGSFEGLQFATNLRELTASGNDLINLSPIRSRLDPLTDSQVGLTRLQYLALDNNRLSDLSPLSGLTALRALSADLNSLHDVSPLASLTNLRFLSLDGAPHATAPGLNSLTQLSQGYERLIGFNDPRGTDNSFGTAMATAGNRVLVSASNYIPTGQAIHSGAVFIFDSVTGELIRTITSPGSKEGGQFGASYLFTASRPKNAAFQHF